MLIPSNVHVPSMMIVRKGKTKHLPMTDIEEYANKYKITFVEAYRKLSSEMFKEE